MVFVFVLDFLVGLASVLVFFGRAFAGVDIGVPRISMSALAGRGCWGRGIGRASWGVWGGSGSCISFLT